MGCRVGMPLRVAMCLHRIEKQYWLDLWRYRELVLALACGWQA